MLLNNRIYSRKVLWRLIYMFNFVKNFVFKDIYLDFAAKVESIATSGLNKISVQEYKKYDFSGLNILPLLTVSSEINPEEYLKKFNPNFSEFDEILAYVIKEVKKKDIDQLEYDYVRKNMLYLIENYDNLVELFDKFLPKFKFFEIESITQSILLLAKVEAVNFQTPKAVLIKEADLLAEKFTSDSNIGLIHALLDKVL